MRDLLDNGRPLSEDTARRRMDAAVVALTDMPHDTDGCEGRGVVICGGGLKYFPCAWVCVNMLRRLGCRLPVELWHLGEREMPDAARSLAEPLGVRCVDGLKVRKRHPARVLNGWELKPYAIIHSRFRDVLALDADNVPVVDPTYLFDTPQFKECGAVFWPDYGRLAPTRAVWRLTGVSYRDESEFESGQLLVDKVRCRKELALTMWMNEHSDFWYRHMHGDKETFHMAWRRLDRPYAMPAFGIYPLPGTMCQHDFDGRRVFQHRNMRKWSLGGNSPVPGFEFEHLCLQFLRALRPAERVLRGYPPFDPVASAALAGATVDYHRIGHDRRPMRLEPDGTIGLGQDRMERFWGVRAADGASVVLEIFGDDGLTARLRPDPSDPRMWGGAWLIHERMPVEVIISPPVAAVPC